MKGSSNLDLMRSVAVLSVVLAHAGLYSGHGQMSGWLGITGVSFFFVHTSLVLMFSLERDPVVGSFYLRRIFRIYPLWLAMVAIITVFRLPQFPPAYIYMFPGWRALLANVTLTFNMIHTREIVGAGWTLPIEVDMYLFLPVLFFFVRGVRKLWPLLVFDGFLVLFNHQNFGQVSFLPMCVPSFLPGIMAYVRWRGARRVLPAWLFPCLLAVLIAGNQLAGNWQRNWIACLVLGLSLPYFKEQSSVLLRQIAHVVAKYSYGIYLTHIAALVVVFHLMPGRSLALRLSVFLALVSVAAVGLYHLVEEPMIRLGAKLASRLPDRHVPRITESVLTTEPAP